MRDTCARTSCKVYAYTLVSDGTLCGREEGRIYKTTSLCFTRIIFPKHKPEIQNTVILSISFTCVYQPFSLYLLRLYCFLCLSSPLSSSSPLLCVAFYKGYILVNKVKRDEFVYMNLRRKHFSVCILNTIHPHTHHVLKNGANHYRMKRQRLIPRLEVSAYLFSLFC